MLPSQRIEFEGAGGEQLAARLDRPAGPARAFALFAHCFSCSKDLHAAHRLARRLVDHGIGVLRFDFTGLGQSEGDFANTNFSSNVADVIAAARWLGETEGGPQLLVGHSLGGAAVIVAAAHLPGVKAVATIGAPADADHVLNAFSSDLERIEETGEASVSLGGRSFTIRRQFLEDVRGARVRDAAAALGRPLLVLHAPLDDSVGLDNATGLFTAARHPKSFVSLDTADHLLSSPGDARYAADVIAAWVSRYGVPGGEEQPRQGEPGCRAVQVSETGQGRFENAVVIGGQRYIADEPVAVGGGGRGPDPYEWVTAGLGACTSMTVRMYAERKGWQLERVEVTLRHAKDHAKDCAECEAGRKIDIFEREIRLVGDLDQDQRARLLEIADKCPVHRTLHDRVEVRTRLHDADATPSPK